MDNTAESTGILFEKDILSSLHCIVNQHHNYLTQHWAKFLIKNQSLIIVIKLLKCLHSSGLGIIFSIVLYVKTILKMMLNLVSILHIFFLQKSCLSPLYWLAVVLFLWLDTWPFLCNLLGFPIKTLMSTQGSVPDLRNVQVNTRNKVCWLLKTS